MSVWKAATTGILGAAIMACACGCQGNRAAMPRAAVVRPASEAQQRELLDRVKTLEGTWELADHEGEPMLTVFKVSSAGSAVREIMLPGSGHEMTNMYHMDGPTLVMTHYCAVGNQPRMRAHAADGDSITFRFDSVTNRTSADQTYMGEMRLVFVDKDTIREEWMHFPRGDGEGQAIFELKRKK
jgi:hypothetical protein